MKIIVEKEEMIAHHLKDKEAQTIEMLAIINNKLLQPKKSGRMQCIVKSGTYSDYWKTYRGLKVTTLPKSINDRIHIKIVSIDDCKNRNKSTCPMKLPLDNTYRDNAACNLPSLEFEPGVDLPLSHFGVTDADLTYRRN